MCIQAAFYRKMCFVRMCMHGHNPKTTFAHGYFMHTFFLDYSAYFQQICMLARRLHRVVKSSLASQVGLSRRMDDLRCQLSNFPSADPPLTTSLTKLQRSSLPCSTLPRCLSLAIAGKHNLVHSELRFAA